MQMQIFLWQVASSCEKIYPRVTVLYRPEDQTFEINLTGINRKGAVQCSEVSLVTKTYLELAVISLILRCISLIIIIFMDMEEMFC